jgi:hypothetical protein
LRRLRSRSLEESESESDADLDSESLSELESDESEPEDDDDLVLVLSKNWHRRRKDQAHLLARFLDDPSSVSFVNFSLSFSLASNILLAVPLLQLKVRHESNHQYGYTNFVKNSSGTSTEGFPSAFSFASTRGFSSCCVRDGRLTYGRVVLHS